MKNQALHLRNFRLALVEKTSTSDLKLMKKLLNFKPLIDGLISLGVDEDVIFEYCLEVDRMEALNRALSEKVLKLIEKENISKAKINEFFFYYFNCVQRNYITICRQWHYNTISVKEFVKLVKVVTDAPLSKLSKRCPPSILIIKAKFWRLMSSRNDRDIIKNNIDEVLKSIMTLSTSERKFYFEDRIPNYLKFTSSEVVKDKLYKLIVNYCNYGVPYSTELKV